MLPRSIDTISVSHLVYMGRIARATPITDKTVAKSRRDHRIRSRYEAGEGVSELARVYGISKQRVWQIIRRD